MTKLGILVPAALVTLFFLASCQQPNLSGYAQKNSNTPTGVCLNCHAAGSAAYDLTGAPAVAKAQLAFAGHENGLRELSSTGTVTWSTTALEETAAGCSKCHTNSGFISWDTNGPAGQTSSTDYVAMANTSITVAGGAAVEDPLTCMACHTPHVDSWVMALRDVRPVKLPSGMFTSGYTSANVFDGGNGNLCANCHQDRTSPDSLMNKLLGKVSLANPSTNNNLPPNATSTNTAGVASTGTSTDLYITAGRVEHHGVQSDFMLGVDSAGSVVNTILQPVVGSGTYKPNADLTVSAVIDANNKNTADAWTGAAYTYGLAGGAYQISLANPTFAKSVHYNHTNTAKVLDSPADTCVTCHVDLNVNATPGQQSSHGMYLSSATGDYLTGCVSCHTGAAVGGPIAAAASPTSFEDVVVGPKIKITDLAIAYAKLIDYFGNGSNFRNAPNKYWTFDSDITPTGTVQVSPVSLASTNPGAIVSVATAALMSGTSATVVPTWKTVTFTRTAAAAWTGTAASATATSGSAKYYTQVTSTKAYIYGDSTSPATTLNVASMASGQKSILTYLTAPAVVSGPYLSTSGTKYGVDWTLNSTGADGGGNYMTLPQTQAFWNLMLFAEDRSDGIHNPLYGAQILYDALTLLGVTPSTVVASWTARPSTY